MLSALLVIGLFAVELPAEEGVVVAVDEATVVFPTLPTNTAIGDLLPLGAPKFLRPLDPSDRAPYAVDFALLVGPDIELAEIVRITMSAAGAAVGVTIEDADPRRPLLDEAGKQRVQVWLSVASDSQNNVAFRGAGVDVGIAFLVRTNEDIPRDFERTAVLPVRQM